MSNKCVLLVIFRKIFQSEQVMINHTFTIRRRLTSILFFIFICPIHFAQAGWELAWIDRFDGEGVNWDNWTAQIQANFNNEVQCYTDDESSAQRNYEVSDGTLKIIARKQNINCPGLNGQSRTWTSGRLNSKDKGEFLYGRIEARIRFLELKGGTWPAFWMLENRIAEDPIAGDDDIVNWPNPGAGEIDIWEWYANSGSQYITNFFNVGGCGSEIRPNYAGGANDVTEFHNYAIEWTPDNIKFFLDENIVAEHDLSNCAQYEEPMFVLLNVAMGGNIGGAINPSLETATMEVDYVAHCVASTTNNLTQCNEQTPTILDDDNDGVSNSADQCPNTAVGETVDINGCSILTAPPTNAPAPSLAPENVISLFSDAYTNISGIDYNPNWGQATDVSEIQIDGNAVLVYQGLNYQGTDFDQNHQDVSAMEFLHIDYWTHDATTLKLYLISPGPVETAFTFNVEKQSWQSHSISLNQFSGVDLTDTFQLKIEGNGTVYIDNIYFGTQSAVVADSDNDGINDDIDLCPNTPSGIEVDNDGCPLNVNVAPTVVLSAIQDANAITEINRDGGLVTIVAEVIDTNNQDTHVLAWTATGLPSFSENGTELSFSPANISGTSVSVTLEVTDNGSPALSTQVSMSLTLPALPSTPTEVPDTNASSSGGSTNIWVIVGLLGLLFLRRLNVSHPY